MSAAIGRARRERPRRFPSFDCVQAVNHRRINLDYPGRFFASAEARQKSADNTDPEQGAGRQQAVACDPNTRKRHHGGTTAVARTAAFRLRLMASPDRFGMAALSICESLILALKERGVLDDAEIRGLLDDALTAHRNADADGDGRVVHDEVANIVEEIIKGGNSIRLLGKRS